MHTNHTNVTAPVFADAPSITIPDDKWESLDADRDRLITVISINGTLMHLEAFAFAPAFDPADHDIDDDHIENHGESSDLVSEEAQEAISTLLGDWPPLSTTIAGRAYTLAATAFGD